jgi:anti-anti-sigma regulatory factor
MGVLVDTRRIAMRICEKGGDLKLVSPSAAVQKVFQLTRLNQFFETHDGIEAAEKSFT